MKKKIILLGIAAALVAATLIGGALSAVQADGETITQSLNTQTLDIALEGAIYDLGSDSENTLMPGTEIINRIAVKNTEDITLYARITIQKYWVTVDGEEISKNYELDPNNIILITTAEENGWVVISSDEEEIVMYYTEPIAPGESSTYFLDGFMINEDLDNSYGKSSFKLVVTTDAIQEFDIVDAMLSEWGILATIDADGTIVSIEE